METINGLIETFLPLAGRIARRVRQGGAHDRFDVEDLTQVGTLGLMEAARRYDPKNGGSFETYARVRIRGAVLDEIKRRANDEILMSVSPSRLEEVRDNSARPDPIHRTDLRQSLDRACRRLTEREREVVFFHYYQDLSLSEVSMRLSISKPRVTRIHESALLKLSKTVDRKAAHE